MGAKHGVSGGVRVPFRVLPSWAGSIVQRSQLMASVPRPIESSAVMVNEGVRRLTELPTRHQRARRSKLLKRFLRWTLRIVRASEIT